MNYWKFAPGKNAHNWEVQRDNNYIGIGWAEIGNIIGISKDAYENKCNELAERNGTNRFDGNHDVWEFLHDIQIGDIVFINKGKTSIIGICKVQGEPYYEDMDGNPNYPTRRKVEWLFKSDEGYSLAFNLAISTLTKLDKSKAEDLMNTLVPDKNKIPNKSEASFHQTETSIPTRNIVLFGPPGTGKTHALTALTLSVLDPQQTGCQSYVQSLVYGSSLEAIDSGDYKNWHTELQKHLHAGRVEFTTFHQNYAYEDFVEGLKAKLEGTTVHYTIEPGMLKRIAYRALYAWLKGEKSGSTLSQDQLATVKDFLSGKFSPETVHTSIPNYVLIIDEINRGNVARIFGELITLVEDTKRACRDITRGAQPVFATLPYTQERFILPPNLHIIGTMNTADRSLIGLDAALRRRFDFIELPPRPELLRAVGGVYLSKFLKQLNARIESEDTRDHCIGHAYFMAAESIEDIAEVMRRKVIPQLQEYFYDQPIKLSKLLTSGEGSFVDDSGRINHDMLKRTESYNNFGGA